MPLGCPRHCIDRVRFTPVASNPVSRFIWRWALRALSPPLGSSTASFRRQSGGTISFSPEATCSSSGRKSEFASGARRMGTRCGRLSGLTSSGRSRRLGILLDCRRTLGVLSRTRCARFSLAWVWRVISGIQNHIALASVEFWQAHAADVAIAVADCVELDAVPDRTGWSCGTVASTATPRKRRRSASTISSARATNNAKNTAQDLPPGEF